METRLAQLLAAYPWFEHTEGIKFAELERTAQRSIGHWLFLPGTFSAFHRVTSCDEVWAIHAGHVLLHVLTPAGGLSELQLGPNAGDGERAVATVPAGAWQAAEIPPGEPFAFGTNICAPPFAYEALEMATRADLSRAYPRHTDLIRRLTRL